MSSKYNVFETDEFLHKINKINNRDKRLIQKKLTSTIYNQLTNEPHFGNNIKKLKDYKPETWRYRVGRFRIFYSIDEKEKVIYIITIETRKDSY